MSLQNMPRRLRKILEKAGAWLAVLVFNLVFLLILYNNVYNGILILAILLVPNIGIIIFSRRILRHREFLIETTFASICTVAFLATILSLELLFPMVLPSEYSRIMELSQLYRSQYKRPSANFRVVFRNQDRKRPASAECVRAKKGERTPWHQPGKIIEYYGYEPNEGFKYINIVCWNRDGYFDNDYTHEIEGKVYRIVIVGDSYVEAIQVPLSKTFHKLLESALNNHPQHNRSSPKKFEVIALGNSGAGQRKNLEVLKREAIAYHPNLVLFVLSHNDFCDDDPKLNRDRTLYMGEVSPLLRNILRHNLPLVAFVLDRFYELERNRISVSPELLQWSGQDMPQIETAWRRSLTLVKEARDYCSDLGIEFMLVYTSAELEVKFALDPKGAIDALERMGGSHKSIPWDLSRSIKRMTHFCKEQDINLLVMWKWLVEGQKQTGKVVFGDHYTFFGHEIVAQALIDTLTPKIHSSIGQSDSP